MVESERKPAVPVKKVEEDTRSKKAPPQAQPQTYATPAQPVIPGAGAAAGGQQQMYNYGSTPQYYNNYGNMGYGNYMNNYDMMNYYNYMQQFGQMMNPMNMQMPGMMGQMPTLPQVGTMSLPTVGNTSPGGTTVNTINLNQGSPSHAGGNRSGGQTGDKK